VIVEVRHVDPGGHRRLDLGREFRSDEYEVYRDAGFARWLKTVDVAPVGMRELRDAWRARHVDDRKRGTA